MLYASKAALAACMDTESGGLMMVMPNIASGTESAGQSARFWKGLYSARSLDVHAKVAF